MGERRRIDAKGEVKGGGGNPREALLTLRRDSKGKGRSLVIRHIPPSAHVCGRGGVINSWGESSYPQVLKRKLVILRTLPERRGLSLGMGPLGRLGRFGKHPNHIKERVMV